jgi:gas vesicle protein
MTRPLIASSVAALALFAVACEEKSPSSSAPPNTGAGKGVANAVTAAKDNAVAGANTALASAKKSLDDLNAKFSSVSGDAKTSVAPLVDTAKAKFADAEKAVNDLKAATADTWKSLSEQASKAIGAASDAIKAAMDKIPK